MSSGLLAGRVALVTGACGGIGRAAVRRFLDEGAVVHGLDCDARAGEALEAACRDAARPFTFHAVDLADAAAIDGAVRDCVAVSPEVDVLFNNAGVSIVRDLEATGDDVVDTLWRVNFLAAFRLCRLLVPGMKTRRRGAVLNTASELALVGLPGYTAYCASKGAVLAFTRALALETGPFGVRVNALCPGPTDTAMLQAELDSAADPQAARRENERSVSLGRLGAPEEIAEVALFLVSDRAGFVHGAAVVADGGKTAL